MSDSTVWMAASGRLSARRQAEGASNANVQAGCHSTAEDGGCVGE